MSQQSLWITAQMELKCILKDSNTLGIHTYESTDDIIDSEMYFGDYFQAHSGLNTWIQINILLLISTFETNLEYLVLSNGCKVNASY